MSDLIKDALSEDTFDLYTFVEMVATRHHPTEFPPPALTPSQSPSPATSQTLSSSNDATSPSATQRSVRKANVSARATSDTEDQIRDGWLHTPSNLTLLWLAISLPLVLWDCGFLLLRPWTLPGGSIHSPIWIPYKLYGEVDWTYSVAAWHEGDGFGHAQATLNVIETLGYLAYLWVVFIYGMESGSGKLQKIKGRGAPTGLMKYAPQLAKARVVRGHHGAMAVIGGFGVSAITISKTVLYCKYPRSLHFTTVFSFQPPPRQSLIAFIPSSVTIAFALTPQVPTHDSLNSRVRFTWYLCFISYDSVLPLYIRSRRASCCLRDHTESNIV